MTKYNINICMYVFHTLAPDLNLNDAAILDYLKDIYLCVNKKALKKINENGHDWILLKYNDLITDMPYLQIEKQTQIVNSIKRLKEVKFIDYKRKTKTNLYFRLLDKVDELAFFKISNENIKEIQKEVETEKQIKDESFIILDKNNEKVKISKEEHDEIVNKIIKYYKKMINVKAQAKQKAISKIKTRLKENSPAELVKAIRMFSRNDWRMENNSHLGISWFFRSDDQIVTFLQLKQDREPEKINLMKHE